MEKKHLDIILPCYNPTEGWVKRILDSVHRIQTNLPNTILHLILVNDGSSKGIQAADIETLNTHLPHFLYIDNAKNHGKGYVLRTGVAQSNNDFCIYTDIDFPYEEKSFLALYEKLHSNTSDVIAGIKNAHYYKQVPFARKLISRFLRLLIRRLLSISITDTQCGLKGFNKKGKEVFLQTSINRYLFDLEFIFLAERNSNVRLSAIPIQLKPDVVFSSMNMKILLTEGRNFMKIFWQNFFK